MYFARKRLTVIDLFAGVGGLSYGFAHDRRFELVAANEVLHPMAKAYALNHPMVKMYEGDIADFGAAAIGKDLGIRRSDIDVIIGGPPCQAYSTIGKRLLDDPRGMLFREYVRVLKEFKPRLFIFENVKGLLSMAGGELIGAVVSLFESIGYTVTCKVLNAADFGVPQRRERVIIVGTADGKEFAYPSPTHYDPTRNAAHDTAQKPYLTLSDAIGDLPLIRSGESSYDYACEPHNDYQRAMRANAPKKLMDHIASKSSSRLVRLMESLPDGGRPHDLPEIPDWFTSLRSFPNTYSRLWWRKPSTTITRNFSAASGSRCIHPLTPRPLTTREGARLQSFPDDFRFYGSRSDKNLQIGNAVPPFLSAALAEAVARHLLGGDERCELPGRGERHGTRREQSPTTAV